MKDEIFDLLSELETYVSDTELTRDITEMLTQEFEVNDPSPERAKDVYVRSDRLARVIHDRLYRETETVAGIFNRLWETLIKKKPTEGGWQKCIGFKLFIATRSQESRKFKQRSIWRRRRIATLRSNGTSRTTETTAS